jgi:hypothetical protein
MCNGNKPSTPAPLVQDLEKYKIIAGFELELERRLIEEVHDRISSIRRVNFTISAMARSNKAAGMLNIADLEKKSQTRSTASFICVANWIGMLRLSAVIARQLACTAVACCRFSNSDIEAHW